MFENRCPPHVTTDSVMEIIRWGQAMERNDDMIRQLLLDIEAQPDPLYLMPLHLGMTPEERVRYYHMRLLVDAGMLEESGKAGGVFRMTNAGHDFLALTRQSQAWEAVKAAAAKLGGASVKMLLQIAEGIARQKLVDMGILSA